MSSILRYNGVDIPFIKTEKFIQEPVWSNDGTDLLYTHICIGVSGILNKCFLNGVEPADWIEQNRPLLLQRGFQLYFMLNGTQVFPPAVGNGGTPSGKELVASPWYKNPSNVAGPQNMGSTDIHLPFDGKLGPKPARLDIRSIKGGTCAIYYEIDTWVPYCIDGDHTSPILSNRWERTIDIDKEYFYTATTNGVLVINGQYMGDDASLLATLNANYAIILPPIPKSWKREQIRIARTPDGLQLNYTIIDRQCYVAIPRPAVHIDASYTEVAPAPMKEGMPMLALLNMQQLTMDVRIHGEPSYDYYGDPNAPIPTTAPTGCDFLKYYLMKVMFQLVFSRIQHPWITELTGGKPNNWADNQFIQHFELYEDVMQPIVGCKVVAFQSRRLKTNAMTAASWQTNVFTLTNVGQPITLADVSNKLARQPTTLPNFAEFLFVQSAAAYDGCGCGSSLTCRAINQEGGGYQIALDTNIFTTTLVTADVHTQNPQDGTATYDNQSSLSNYRFPFTEYSGEVSYFTDDHTLQLPIMYDVDQKEDNSCEFAINAAPTSRKVVHWKASRMSQWPMAPKPNALDLYGDSSPRDKVINYQVGLAEAELREDMITKHYVISGIYEIAMARRLQWDTATAIAGIVNPAIASSVWMDQYSAYPCSLFLDGILNAGTSPGAGS